jgi:hypothetical protein
MNKYSDLDFAYFCWLTGHEETMWIYLFLHTITLKNESTRNGNKNNG